MSELALVRAIIDRIRTEIANSNGHNQVELGHMKEKGDRLYLVPDTAPTLMIGPDIYLVDRTLAFVPDYPMTRTLMSSPRDANNKGEQHSDRWGWHKHDIRTGNTLVPDSNPQDHSASSDTEADFVDTYVSALPGTGDTVTVTTSAVAGAPGATPHAHTAAINQSETSHDHEHRLQIPLDEGDPEKSGQWRTYDEDGRDNYNEHTHDIMLPWRFEPLKNGDRVLVNWAVGNIPVIVSVVHRGTHKDSKTLYDGTVIE